CVCLNRAVAVCVHALPSWRTLMRSFFPRQDGHLWIPVSVNKFDNLETDPLVKMCQVNYDSYSEAPWLLPMGGLLSIASGCADLKRDTVQIVHMSTLKVTCSLSLSA
ncbi:unnamed protein product, partial [Ectocarpus sp. 12 AP-2014]